MIDCCYLIILFRSLPIFENTFQMHNVTDVVVCIQVEIRDATFNEKLIGISLSSLLNINAEPLKENWFVLSQTIER